MPLVIVGNKSDLKRQQRQVETEDGRRLAKEFKCGFTEASAQQDVNVSEAFQQLISEIEKTQNPSAPTEGSKCSMM